MTNKSTSNSYTNRLALFLLVTVLICCTPILNKGVLLGGLSILSLFFVIITPHSRLFRQEKSLLFYVGLFLFITFFYKFLGYSDATWSRYVLLTLSLMIILLSPLLQDTLIAKESSRAWWLMVIICSLDIVWNIYFAILNPELHENMDMFDLEYIQSINVGGSNFYSFSLFFYILCFFVYLNANNKSTKRLMLICTIVSGAFIIGFCFKASVVVLMLLASFLLYLFKGKTGFDSIAFGILVAVSILVLLFFAFSSEISSLIATYSPSERLTRRLIGLLNSNDSVGGSSSFEARQDLWRLSLNTWLDNPMSFLIGVGDHFAAGGNIESGVGQHSEFLDLLACYGIFGGLLVFLVLKKSWGYMLSIFDKNLRSQIYVILFIYAICGFAKLVFIPALSCAVYIMLPMSSMLVNKRY